MGIPANAGSTSVSILEGPSRCLWFCILCAWIAPFPADAAEPDIDLSGRVEFGGTYDTNIFLTAQDYDFELERIAGARTEEEDFLGYLLSDLKLAIPVTESYLQSFRYLGRAERFDEFNDENREKHRFEFLPSIDIAPKLVLLPEYAYEFDNRRSGAEYLRPDYHQHQAGGRLQWSTSSQGSFRFRYLYQHQDYEFIPETSFDDYESHVGEVAYEHRFSDRTLGEAALVFMHREYTDDTRDPFGEIISGLRREDERTEVRLALTHMPTRGTLLKGGYLHRDHAATGQFYDYNLHRVSGIFVQHLPWYSRLQGYVHYEWKDYVDQVAQVTRVVDDEVFQEFIDEVRADTQLLILLTLVKDIGKGFSTGLEFQHLDNRSNNDSSEYESQRYTMFARYEF